MKMHYDRDVVRLAETPHTSLQRGDLVKADDRKIVWKVHRVYRRTGLVALFDGSRIYRVLPSDCTVLLTQNQRSSHDH